MDLKEMMTQVEALAVRTENGSFVSLDDLRRLMQEQSPSEPPPDAPKTVEEARLGARSYLKSQGLGAPPSVGRAIPAAQPVSRPLSEGGAS